MLSADVADESASDIMKELRANGFRANRKCGERV